MTVHCKFTFFIFEYYPIQLELILKRRERFQVPRSCSFPIAARLEQACWVSIRVCTSVVAVPWGIKVHWTQPYLTGRLGPCRAPWLTYPHKQCKCKQRLERQCVHPTEAAVRQGVDSSARGWLDVCTPAVKVCVTLGHSSPGEAQHSWGCTSTQETKTPALCCARSLLYWESRGKRT